MPVEVIVNGTAVAQVEVEETGSWQQFERRQAGEIDLPAGDQVSLELRPVRKGGVGVMNLRRIDLRPAG